MAHSGGSDGLRRHLGRWLLVLRSLHISIILAFADGHGSGGATLVIIPFADLGEGAESKLYALGLTEELLNELPRFKELKVFGRETSEAISPQADASSIQKELGTRYLLAGGVRVSGGRVRVDARLVEAKTGEILWSRTYNEDLRSRDLIAIQSEIAGKVASAVAQPYGVISQAEFTHSQEQPPDDLGAYLCTLRFYAYRADLRADMHAAARNCLEAAVARFPTFATAWAMLSIAYLDEDRFLFNSRTGSSPPDAGARSRAPSREA
jgi:adenylate cyclase